MENNTNNTQFKAQPNKNTVYRSRNIKKKKINGGFDFLSDKRFLWNSLNTFISAFLGGIAFAIGTTVFLTVNNKNVGSALFSLGMIIILAYGFGFYTSKIGYSLKNTKEQNILLIPIWIGNLLGALFVSGLLGISETKLIDTFASRANQICSVTLSNSLGGVLVLSIFCGLLMFIATDNYKNAKNAAQKYITLILASMVFLLCGFEHFTSSAFLFSMADSFNIKAFWYLIIMTLGNTIGALIIPISHAGVKMIQAQQKKSK